MSDYNNFQGRCIGRVMHFISHYYGNNAAENCQSDTYRVILYNKEVGTISWKFGDLPLFNFNEDNSDANYRQEEKMLVALQDSWGDPNHDRPNILPEDNDKIIFLGNLKDRTYFSLSPDHNVNYDIWYHPGKKIIYAVDKNKTYRLSLLYPKDRMLPIEQKAYDRVEQYLFAKKILENHYIRSNYYV